MKNPTSQFGLASAAPATAAGLVLHFRAGLHWLVAALIAVNAATAALYAWDKLAARRGWRRVPERLLHAWSLAGGSPAALAAQHLLRHKTIKPGFRRTFWIIVAVQVAALAAWWQLASEA